LENHKHKQTQIIRLILCVMTLIALLFEFSIVGHMAHTVL